MNDIWTMIWKETKDSVLQGGWSALIRPLLLIGILGIVFPLRLGLQWLALTPLVMGLVLYIPFTVILSFVGDAIAGERERHTLETLLASRISDRAILPARQSTGREWRRADLDAVSHGAAGATNSHRGHVGAGRRRCAGTQSRARADDLLVEQFPDLAHCHGRACGAGCDLAGRFAGEFPPLALDVELKGEKHEDSHPFRPGSDIQRC